MQQNTLAQLLLGIIMVYVFSSCNKQQQQNVMEKSFRGKLSLFERGYNQDRSGILESRDTIDFWITAKLVADSIHFTTADEATLRLQTILANQPEPFNHKYYLPSSRPSESFAFTKDDSFIYRWSLLAPIGPSAKTIVFLGKM